MPVLKEKGFVEAGGAGVGDAPKEKPPVLEALVLVDVVDVPPKLKPPLLAVAAVLLLVVVVPNEKLPPVVLLVAEPLSPKLKIGLEEEEDSAVLLSVVDVDVELKLKVGLLLLLAPDTKLTLAKGLEGLLVLLLMLP